MRPHHVFATCMRATTSRYRTTNTAENAMIGLNSLCDARPSSRPQDEADSRNVVAQHKDVEDLDILDIVNVLISELPESPFSLC
jgi:hypothetical protein